VNKSPLNVNLETQSVDRTPISGQFLLMMSKALHRWKGKMVPKKCWLCRLWSTIAEANEASNRSQIRKQVYLEKLLENAVFTLVACLDLGFGLWERCADNKHKHNWNLLRLFLEYTRTSEELRDYTDEKIIPAFCLPGKLKRCSDFFGFKILLF